MADAPEPGSARRGGKRRWELGWIVLPRTIIAALFLAGVHVGARRPDQGMARLLLKLFGGQPGVAVVESESEPLKPRPGAKPGEPFEYSAVLTAKQLQAIADKSLGLTVADLDCAHVCRAWSKAEYEIDVYSVATCELGRPGTWAPAMLLCRGT